MSKRTVPALGFALILAQLAPNAVAQATDYRRENPVSARSTLRWDAETVDSIIALDAKKESLTMPTGRAAALETIETSMPSLLADTLFSIPLNSSQRLGDAVAAGTVSLGDVYRIIDAGKKTPPTFSSDLAFISMAHSLSLAQIGSLFVTHSVASGATIPLQTVPSRAYTGILIDARGKLPVHGEHSSARLEPCLFPRIWDSDMNLLYEKNSVDPNGAKTRGIAHYASGIDDASLRSRIGADPLRIVAREVYGNNRTDPLISREDFLKVMSMAENRALLLEGKVVMLVDAESLDAKNLGPVRDDGYYFVRREIDRSLASKPVEAMDFTDGWEGLKLTVYDIRFVADTADIVPSERSRIDAIADALSLAGKNATYTVEGHTASVGKPGGEMALSVQRAAKIADELAKRGIERSRIRAAGFGGTRPIATNDTDEGRAKNRRVEITISLGGQR
jgi:outer membrane protein OmpA-like peptidoglycan-associated protein